MLIKEIRLRHFRNYPELELAFPPGLIWIAGPNGAGKTNLLEAVHLICCGVSHRTHRDSELVTWGRDGYHASGMIENRLSTHQVSAIFRAGVGKSVELDGRVLERRSELMEVASAVTFAPDDLAVIKGSPSGRRRLLDRLCSYRDRRHVAHLQRLRAVLEQRNELLRQLRAGRTSEQTAGLFDSQLLDLSARIRAGRASALLLLRPRVQEQLEALGGREVVSFLYQEDGRTELPLDDAIAQGDFWRRRAEASLHAWSREERLRGRTLWGPQRDDVILRLDDHDARTFASQGQQRSLVLALKRAELAWVEEALGSPPVLLLDDVLSELDAHRARSLLELAGRHPQAFLTATDAVPQPTLGFEPVARLRISAGTVEVLAP